MSNLVDMETLEESMNSSYQHVNNSLRSLPEQSICADLRYIFSDSRLLINSYPLFTERTQLDCYFPSLKFAIEVQGPHHFSENSDGIDISIRDHKKISLCRDRDIELLQIPSFNAENYHITDLLEVLKIRLPYIKDHIDETYKKVIEHDKKLDSSTESIEIRQRKEGKVVRLKEPILYTDDDLIFYILRKCTRSYKTFTPGVRGKYLRKNVVKLS